MPFMVTMLSTASMQWVDVHLPAPQPATAQSQALLKDHSLLDRSSRGMRPMKKKEKGKKKKKKEKKNKSKKRKSKMRNNAHSYAFLRILRTIRHFVHHYAFRKFCRHIRLT